MRESEYMTIEITIIIHRHCNTMFTISSIQVVRGYSEFIDQSDRASNNNNYNN